MTYVLKAKHRTHGWNKGTKRFKTKANLMTAIESKAGRESLKKMGYLLNTAHPVRIRKKVRRQRGLFDF